MMSSSNNNNSNNNNNGEINNNDLMQNIATKIEQREEIRVIEKRKNKELTEQRQLDLTTTDKLKEIITDINVLNKECSCRLDNLIEQQSSAQTQEYIQKEIEEVTSLISMIKDIFQENSIILPSFELKNITSILTKLDSKLQETKNKIQPKQKFLFVKKKKSDSSSPSTTITKKSISTTTTTTTTVSSQEIDNNNCNEKTTPILNFETIKYQKDKTINFPQDVDVGSTPINDLSISFVDGCSITIGAGLTSLKINNGINQSLIIAKEDIDGSVFIDSCNNVKFYMKARQIRIHNCTNCQFYISTKSHPIIEGCKDIGFAPFNNNLDEETNQFWCKVNDFDWLQAKQSPNWHIISIDDRIYF